jgi:hypothetical protein
MISVIYLLLWLSMFVSAYIVIIGFRYKTKTDFTTIKIYSVSTLAIYMLLNFDNFFPFPFERGERVFVNIFSILEIILLNHFFYVRMKNRFRRLLTLCFTLIYIIFCIYFWTKFNLTLSILVIELLAFEYICIAIPAALFLNEILRANLKPKLFSDPTFIMSCGILLYSSLLPAIFYFGIFGTNEGYRNSLTFIQNLVSFLFLLSILKAFQCNRQLPA